MKRARIIPNVDCVFLISILNTSDKEYVLPSRKVVGTLHKVGETAAHVLTPKDFKVDLQSIPMEVDCDDEAKEKLCAIINEYSDIQLTPDKLNLHGTEK
mgnify:CR=1 FL=1